MSEKVKTLTEQKCQKCGDLIMWDDTPNPICLSCEAPILRAKNEDYRRALVEIANTTEPMIPGAADHYLAHAKNRAKEVLAARPERPTQPIEGESNK